MHAVFQVPYSNAQTSTCLIVFHDFLENKQGNIFKLQPYLALRDTYSTVLSVFHMIIVVITENAYTVV